MPAIPNTPSASEPDQFDIPTGVTVPELTIAIALAHGAGFATVDADEARDINEFQKEEGIGDPRHPVKEGDVLFVKTEEYFHAWDSLDNYRTLQDFRSQLETNPAYLVDTAFLLSTGYDLDANGDDLASKQERAEGEGWELPVTYAELIAHPDVLAAIPEAKERLAEVESRINADLTLGEGINPPEMVLAAALAGGLTITQVDADTADQINSFRKAYADEPDLGLSYDVSPLAQVRPGDILLYRTDEQHGNSTEALANYVTLTEAKGFLTSLGAEGTVDVAQAAFELATGYVVDPLSSPDDVENLAWKMPLTHAAITQDPAVRNELTTARKLEAYIGAVVEVGPEWTDATPAILAAAEAGMAMRGHVAEVLGLHTKEGMTSFMDNNPSGWSGGFKEAAECGYTVSVRGTSKLVQVAMDSPSNDYPDGLDVGVRTFKLDKDNNLTQGRSDLVQIVDSDVQTVPDVLATLPMPVTREPRLKPQQGLAR